MAETDVGELIAWLLDALQVARVHVYASSEAEHMMDGFGPRKARPSDEDLELVDAAIAVALRARQETP